MTGWRRIAAASMRADTRGQAGRPAYEPFFHGWAFTARLLIWATRNNAD